MNKNMAEIKKEAEEAQVGEYKERDAGFSGTMENIYLAEARVYIAGVLMPAVNINITCTFNQPPFAEISMPAYIELMSLGEHDRVPVLVFVRETMVDNPEFILMFEGFIVQTSYANSALQRTVTVTAVSHFDILNDIQVKFMNKLDDIFTRGLAMNENQMMTAQGNMVLPYPLFILKYGLVTDGDRVADAPIKYPSDYLENVYAFVQKSKPVPGSEKPPINEYHGSALTEFYGKYARTYNFLDRFERLPYFDIPGNNGLYAWESGEVKVPGPDAGYATAFPMIYGMRQEAIMTALATTMCNAETIPNQTLREILDFLYEQLEYEYLYITNPAYHGEIGKREDEADNNKKEDDKSSSGNRVPSTTRGDPFEQTGSVTETKPKTDDGDTDAQKDRKLVSSVVKPIFSDTYPPGCNVIYRSHCLNLSTVMQHKGIPTRIKMLDQNGPLAKLAASANDFSLLLQRGMIDFYPSKKYDKFDVSEDQKYLNWFGEELLEIEKYTGPWVKEMRAQPWLHYLARSNYMDEVIKVEGAQGEQPSFKAFFERYMRRQLLNSKYFMRQMDVQETFDPYITPGFPSVVFDNNDSGFAYAGHVVTVSHTISPTDVSTRVSLNFVRPLSEAVKIVIPNPLTMIQQVTHDEYKLSEIYQTILGTPVAARKKVDKKQDDNKADNKNENGEKKEESVWSLITGGPIPGADAYSFEDLEKQCAETRDIQHPNNNPKVAYSFKRRNVCTFDRYLDFMKMSAKYGEGPEGPSTPLLLTGPSNGDVFSVEDRRKLEIYQKKIVYDPIIPGAEQVTGPKESEPARQRVPSTTRRDPLEPTGSTSTAQKIIEENAEKKKREEGAKKEVVVKTEIDIREMLRKIAKREFNMTVYK